MNRHAFLVLHKVRGEPAFDIAERIVCPICANNVVSTGETSYGCEECADNGGFWWIIPTSGHRAYPWRWWPLFEGRWQSQAEFIEWDDIVQPKDELVNGLPSPWPDHYPSTASPSEKVDLSSIVAALAPKQVEKRRA